jgi:hypothetical protein
MAKRFKELLLTQHQKPMYEQKVQLAHTLTEWIDIGNETQTDDITVMGVKIV